MKTRYWLTRRGTTFYAMDSETGRRLSLRTTDRHEAEKMLHARNDVADKPRLGLALAKVYLEAYDPRMDARVWQDVMDEFSRRGGETTRLMRLRKLKRRVFDTIRTRKLVDTTAEDFMEVLRQGGVMDHAILRSLHNLAVGLGWLPWPVLAPKLWPQPRAGRRRAITEQEHGAILKSEQNEERRLYYDLIWETGASQTDAAELRAECLDWRSRQLSYQRKKTGTWAYLSIGRRLESILRRLPSTGLLFPGIAGSTVNARSAEFARRCRVAGIKGVSLHSYRYAWAERAKSCGYPERFAQQALGHGSKAVHRAYARGADVVVPSLESFESSSPTPTPVRKPSLAGKPDTTSLPVPGSDAVAPGLAT